MSIEAKVIIDKEKCKGCKLCISVCPKDILEVSKQSNNNGYFPAQPKKELQKEHYTENCTACTNCAIICPDVCIEVYKN